MKQTWKESQAQLRWLACKATAELEQLMTATIHDAMVSATEHDADRHFARAGMYRAELLRREEYERAGPAVRGQAVLARLKQELAAIPAAGS